MEEKGIEMRMRRGVLGQNFVMLGGGALGVREEAEQIAGSGIKCCWQVGTSPGWVAQKLRFVNHRAMGVHVLCRLTHPRLCAR